MRSSAGLVALTLAAAALAAGCSRGALSKGPTRESVTPLLQNEAVSLKNDGEKMNPALGVKATWTLTGVDVVEQPENKTQPFRGVVKFRINSQTQEPTGVVEHNFERKYDYVYDTTLNKWLMVVK